MSVCDRLNYVFTNWPSLLPQFSDMLLHTKPSGTGTFEFKDEMPIFGMRVNLLLRLEIKKFFLPHSPLGWSPESVTGSPQLQCAQHQQGTHLSSRVGVIDTYCYTSTYWLLCFNCCFYLGWCLYKIKLPMLYICMYRASVWHVKLVSVWGINVLLFFV